MRKQRSDGAEARAHLLRAALRLFSEKGFAKTSTRDIAQATGANLGAISSLVTRPDSTARSSTNPWASLVTTFPDTSRFT